MPQAANWFRKPAEQGYASAQYNLGVAYGQGEGVPKDFVEAIFWYRKAAEQGDADAQYNLGLIITTARESRRMLCKPSSGTRKQRNRV